MSFIFKQELSAKAMNAAYQLVLGRPCEPKDREALSKHQRTSLAALYEHLLHSVEFRNRVAPRADLTLLNVVQSQFFSAQNVETRVDDKAILDKLLDRTLRQWKAHGEKDPLWSITTDDQYRAEVMTEERLEQFYASGKVGPAVIDIFEKRSGRRLKGGICLELGAGVGRCTEHLAGLFDRVIAVDISPGILDLCEKRMRDKNIQNVDVRQLEHPSDIETYAPFDLFFSISVLQHNTPPIQRLMLEHAIAGLSPGGHCLFQAPDRMNGYSFSARDFADAAMWDHDMHCLPKTAVLESFAEHGMTVIDVIADGFVPEFGSYSYLAQK